MKRGRRNGSETPVVDPARRRPDRCDGIWRTIRNNAAPAYDGFDHHAQKFDGSYVISVWRKTYEVVQSRNWKARTKQDGSAVPVGIKHRPPHSPCQIPVACGPTSSC
ncbi:hypothetical protein OROGR_003539 [Orobanche gracilis]